MSGQLPAVAGAGHGRAAAAGGRKRTPVLDSDRVFANRRLRASDRREIRRGGRRLDDLIGLDAALRLAGAGDCVEAGGWEGQRR
jgi:hypothetical protein